MEIDSSDSGLSSWTQADLRALQRGCTPTLMRLIDDTAAGAWRAGAAPEEIYVTAWAQSARFRRAGDLSAWFAGLLQSLPRDERVSTSPSCEELSELKARVRQRVAPAPPLLSPWVLLLTLPVSLFLPGWSLLLLLLWWGLAAWAGWRNGATLWRRPSLPRALANRRASVALRGWSFPLLTHVVAASGMTLAPLTRSILCSDPTYRVEEIWAVGNWVGLVGLISAALAGTVFCAARSGVEWAAAGRPSPFSRLAWVAGKLLTAAAGVGLCEMLADLKPVETFFHLDSAWNFDSAHLSSAGPRLMIEACAWLALTAVLSRPPTVSARWPLRACAAGASLAVLFQRQWVLASFDLVNNAGIDHSYSVRQVLVLALIARLVLLFGNLWCGQVAWFAARRLQPTRAWGAILGAAAGTGLVAVIPLLGCLAEGLNTPHCGQVLQDGPALLAALGGGALGGLLPRPGGSLPCVAGRPRSLAALGLMAGALACAGLVSAAEARAKAWPPRLPAEVYRLLRTERLRSKQSAEEGLGGWTPERALEGRRRLEALGSLDSAPRIDAASHVVGCLSPEEWRSAAMTGSSVRERCFEAVMQSKSKSSAGPFDLALARLRLGMQLARVQEVGFQRLALEQMLNWLSEHCLTQRQALQLQTELNRVRAQVAAARRREIALRLDDLCLRTSRSNLLDRLCALAERPRYEAVEEVYAKLTDPVRAIDGQQPCISLEQQGDEAYDGTLELLACTRLNRPTRVALESGVELLRRDSLVEVRLPTWPCRWRCFPYPNLVRNLDSCDAP